MATHRWTVFSTDLGWSACTWTDRMLLQLTFGHATPPLALEQVGPLGDEGSEKGPLIRDVVDRVTRFAAGDFGVDFEPIELDLSWTTDFQRRVLEQVREIGPGETLSYGEVAERVGHTGAARAVGSVMAKNRFPLIIPCHRVVSAHSLGGYSAAEGLRMKERLLTAEAAYACNAPASAVAKPTRAGKMAGRQTAATRTPSSIG